MELKSTEDRKITLSGEITQDSVKKVYEFIIQMNQEDEQLLNLGVNQLQPIEVYIDSFGGGVHAALGVIGVMNESVTPIHTFALGSIMSSALPIYLMGDIRRATQFSTFMYHEISSHNSDYLTEMSQELAASYNLQTIYDAIITKKSKVKQSALNKIKKEKRSWYFGYEEALKLGIINQPNFR